MFLQTNRVLFAILALFLISSKSVESANILGLMGVASPSHHIWNSVLLHELANQGHNLTILSVDLSKNPKDVPPNVTYIHLEETYATMYKTGAKDEKVDINEFIGINPIQMIPMFYDFSLKTCQGVLKSKGLQTLLNYPDDFKFDLVIHDYSTGPYLLGFLHKFKYPPLVGLSAFLLPPNTMDQVGYHYMPGYVPYYSTIYDVNMNVFERIHNTVLFAADTLYRRYIYTPEVDRLVRPLFPADMPYLGDLESRTALVLVNSHPAINYPESLPPNVIEVGGMQLVDPKPLPKDLEDFVQKGRKGAILFSLGTNMKSEDMGPEKVKIILDAMAQLPEYNFLWKFDLNQLKFDLPKNVLIRPFYPQRDILAHPKIKAFVTHSGGLSTQESTWRGVPMIGFGLFADQPRNLHKAILSGVAEKVDYLTVTVELLRDTIKKVVEDEKYSRNMKARSARLRDRPMKPLETAVWWVEYVLRNPNPDHLRAPLLELGFVASHSLDVLFIAFGFVAVLIWLISSVCCQKKSHSRTAKRTKYD